MNYTPIYPIQTGQLPADWSACASLHQAAEQVWMDCVRDWPDLTTEVLAEVDSTNSELVRRARAHQANTSLLVAQRQTAGRGRLGRNWHTQTTPALTLSLGLPMAPRDWSGLSLVVGLVLAQQLGHGIGIKWPNDLWWQGRKLCGILVETVGMPVAQGDGLAAVPPPATAGALAARCVVVGMGINLGTPEAADLRTPPVGLAELLQQANALNDSTARRAEHAADTDAQLSDMAAVVMARIVPPLLHALRVFEREGFAPFEADYAKLDVLRQQRVSLSDGRQGLCVGVDQRGAMRVQFDGESQPQAIETGEISVRPLAAL